MTNLGESVGITIKLNPQGLNQFVISQCFITRLWNQILYACEFKLGRATTIKANYHLRYGLHQLNNNVSYRTIFTSGAPTLSSVEYMKPVGRK